MMMLRSFSKKNIYITDNIFNQHESMLWFLCFKIKFNVDFIRWVFTMHTTIESNRESESETVSTASQWGIASLVASYTQYKVIYFSHWIGLFIFFSPHQQFILQCVKKKKKNKSKSVPCDMRFRHSIYEYYILFFTSIKFIQIECHSMIHTSQSLMLLPSKNSFEILNDCFSKLFSKCMQRIFALRNLNIHSFIRKNSCCDG